MQVLKRPPSSRAGRGCLLVFAIFWTGFSLMWTYLAWREGGVVPALFGLPFILVGLILLGALSWRTFAGIRLESPSLTLSSSAVHVGETFSAMYDQRFKGGVDVQEIGVELVFRESATYTRGTDTHTDTHEVVLDAVKSPGRTFQPSETFHQTYRFTIPYSGMHSFDAFHNKLQWFIRVHVRVLNWPDLKDEYEFNVLPERVG
jgi:hypothetical protein